MGRVEQDRVVRLGPHGSYQEGRGTWSLDVRSAWRLEVVGQMVTAPSLFESQRPCQAAH
jgi:hypothetical protein